MDLTGIHHLTAVTAEARQNYQFYTQTMGMRLVKRTVNQDDTSAYHLFYADGRANPGTDLTFFDWPVDREQRGTSSITRTCLRVAGLDALVWWKDRLGRQGYSVAEIVERDDRLTLDFEDFEGQRLSLVDDGGEGQAYPWQHSPVPAEFQIRGLGPIMLSVPQLKTTDNVLQKAMNMRPVRHYQSSYLSRHTVHVYEMGAGGPAAELHIAEQPDLTMCRPGAGGVHHVAFRTPTYESHAGWIEHISGLGIRNSGLVDRYYFRSLYFREPNGILFEIASDGPGFAVDEDEATLGEKVVLPPFLESKRERILANLKAID
ncbi:MAG TPA: ring-cleaving dioxygenase [Levilinea sp.]|nr:ring-cleaving dioxygenase [Levilinea sp.]